MEIQLNHLLCIPALIDFNMPKSPDLIDAQEVLSRWYGPDSIACHSVRIIDDKHGEGEFLVGQNLCGSSARPPMLDRLLVENGGFSTQTTFEDAREHFIDSVGRQFIPGHNLMALATEALSRTYHPKQRQKQLYVVGFDFMRFSNFVIPRQDIAFTGKLTPDETGATGTFNILGAKRPFVRNLRIEEGEILIDEKKAQLLAQDWLFEANAQAMGIMGLRCAKDGIVPVLMEVGKSIFTKIPTLAGQRVISKFEITSTDNSQLLGNASTYTEGVLVASQQDLLLQFIPLDTTI